MSITGSSRGMEEEVGKAASVAIKHGTTPRGVYKKHCDEMDELPKLPGKARRQSAAAPVEKTTP